MALMFTYERGLFAAAEAEIFMKLDEGLTKEAPLTVNAAGVYCLN